MPNINHRKGVVGDECTYGRLGTMTQVGVGIISSVLKNLNYVVTWDLISPIMKLVLAIPLSR